MEGASYMLNELKCAGLNLALSSATPTETLVAIVKRRGWDGFFPRIFGGPVSKAQNLFRISEEQGFAKRDLVMVGDRRIDQNGAAEFGCHFIGVICSDSDFDAPPPHSINFLAQLSSELGRLQI
jgi:phosphoglycolate phosphatase-like HAD superfamily hydrolase